MLPHFRTRDRLSTVALALAAASLALPSAVAWANMAAPPPETTVHHGSVAGEPVGALANVFIEHESLRFDLRPLADAKPVWVEAAYRVRNDGAARDLDLLFVANGLARVGGSVTVDGKPVAATPGAAGPLPASWRAPTTTPGLAPADAPRHDALPYAPTREGTLAFRVALPAGRHKIRVRYPADATAYSVNQPTPVWQLGYVLAPAREWAGFGGADVRIDLPRGWAARTNDASLRRDGDALVGTWRQVPEDALAISAQKPAPGSGGWYALWLVLTGVVLSMLGWISHRLGRALGRRGRTSAWAVPSSIGLTLAWIVASLAGYSAIPSLVRGQAGPYAGEYAIRAMSYGSTFVLALLIPLMLVAGIVVMQLAAYIGRRSVRVLPMQRSPVQPTPTSVGAGEDGVSG